MQRMVTQGNWRPWLPAENLHCPDKTKIMFRSEQFFAVYGSLSTNFKHEILLGVSDFGELEVLCDQPGLYIRLDTEGRSWFKTFEASNPVKRTSDTVYTSLEKPSSLSPEMAAIMRMVKHNENEREIQRAENRKLQDDLRRVQAATRAPSGEPQATASAEKTSAEPIPPQNNDRSAPDAEKSKSGKNLPPVSKLDDPAPGDGAD